MRGQLRLINEIARKTVCHGNRLSSHYIAVESIVVLQYADTSKSKAQQDVFRTVDEGVEVFVVSKRRGNLHDKFKRWSKDQRQPCVS